MKRNGKLHRNTQKRCESSWSTEELKQNKEMTKSMVHGGIILSMPIKRG